MSNIKVGNDLPSAYYFGDSPVQALYNGVIKVYPYEQTGSVVIDPRLSVATTFGPINPISSVGEDQSVIGVGFAVDYRNDIASGSFEFFVSGAFNPCFMEFPINAMPRVDFGSKFTITAWINPKTGSLDSRRIETIVANSRSGSTGDGFKFLFDSNPNIKGINNLAFETGNGTLGGVVSSTGSIIGDQFWHYVAVTCDKNTSQVVLYKNGVALTPVTSSFVNNFSSTGYATGSFLMGDVYNNPGTGISNHLYVMDAYLGVFNIYREKVFTQSEIQSQFDLLKSRYGL
jgi:hypothetical protein